MDNMIKLFDFEFRRNIKKYLYIISITCAILMMNLVESLIKYNKIVGRIKYPNTLLDTVGSFSFNSIASDNVYTFNTGLVFCLIYIVVLWKREFSGKNKSIYTLAMIPQNRINIYFSKVLNILCFTYLYIMSYTATLFISSKILPIFMKGDVYSLGFIKDTIYAYSPYIPYNFESFMTFYIFILGSVICTTSTLYLLSKKVKSILKMILLLIPIGLIYLGLDILVNYIVKGSSLTMIISILSITIIVINILISKSILNKLDF